MSYIDFKPEGHEYRVGGRQVPSVTQILEPLYEWSGIPLATMIQAAERGTAVHRATELYDFGILDEESLDEETAAYLEGYRKFLADTHFTPERVEHKIFSTEHDYAGTLDRTGIMGRHKNVLIDLKSGVVTPVTGPQTAAYAQALSERSGERVSRRYGLYLRPYEYRLVRYDDKLDWYVFRSALNLKRWRQNHGIE